MASLFRDSFDYYSDVTLKWTSGGGAIDLTGAHSRTGIGCLLVGNTSLALPPRTGYTLGVAYNAGALGGWPIQLSSPGGLLFGVVINIDGSISLHDNDTVLATSTPNLITIGVYNYFELQTAGGTGMATVNVRVNGAPIFSGLQGDRVDQISIFTILTPGGGGSAYADDVYVNDNTGTVNTGFLGPVRIGAITASADGAPLQWTPSAGGPHFSLIDQIPQNGGASSVSSSTVGAVDQYHFPLPADVTPFAVVTDVQVSLLAEISSAGARSLGVQQGANASAGQALTTNYHMVLQPYDINPTTGVAWKAADFPGTTFGPVVTA